MGKIRLNDALINDSRNRAKAIATNVQTFINKHTTDAVERAVCRLLGIDGIDDVGVPLPNVVVNHVKTHGDICRGVSYYLGNAILNYHLSPKEIAQQIADGTLSLNNNKNHSLEESLKAVMPYATEMLAIVKTQSLRRREELKRLKEGKTPLLYVIVATGNIYEDVIQAQSAARCGADIIAIIRSTGQSLLDYVPYGATTEGFGGTYATQENFKIMRKALDDVGEELNRYIRLVNYASGLCMPEMASMAALERLDVMLNDSLYGILFRDINMKRTFVDQHFSRMIHAFAEIIINTGEDNYLTTADAVEEAHTVLASQFINEQFALLANLKEEWQGLGHAFEIDPNYPNGFLYEIAHAQAARQIFPKAPLKYMPPTKHMTGNIFQGHVQNALFNVASLMTNQHIHLLGMMTEAIHTPFMQDRALSIENAKYVFNTMKDIGDEITFKENGIIEQRANEVLSKANDLLKSIEAIGLFEALEQGIFAGVKRGKDNGKGRANVYEKSLDYVNVVEEAIKSTWGRKTQ